MKEKPEPPNPNECCESGCNPCVWDIYYEALREWEDAQKSSSSDEENTNLDS